MIHNQLCSCHCLLELWNLGYLDGVGIWLVWGDKECINSGGEVSRNTPTLIGKEKECVWKRVNVFSSGELLYWRRCSRWSSIFDCFSQSCRVSYSIQFVIHEAGLLVWSSGDLKPCNCTEQHRKSKNVGIHVQNWIRTRDSNGKWVQVHEHLLPSTAFSSQFTSHPTFLRCIFWRNKRTVKYNINKSK
jgi:hypothetical protein